MCLIHCYSEHVHIWNTDWMAICKKNKSCYYRNQFIVISALQNHHIVLRMEHFAHDWYAKSHDHFLYFIMHLAVRVHSFSSRSKWVGTSAVKDNKGSVLCIQKAILIMSHWKTFTYPAFTCGERVICFTVSTCWLDTSVPDGDFAEWKRWEEPSGTLLQTLKDENIDNQDRTHAQQNTSWYTLSTAVRLPGILRLPCKVKHLSWCGGVLWFIDVQRFIE